MNITFFGAAHEVTGSCHLLEASGKRILLDCGMFQGDLSQQLKNEGDFPFEASSIDAIVLSHAHADHCGRIPKLFKDGFRGPVYSTKGTAELAAVIWKDSLGIMRHNAKNDPDTVIIFEEKDIEDAMEHCHGVNYHDSVHIGSVRVTFKDAGHIFGSSFIEIEAEGKKIAYSGDLGNSNVPILRETDQLGDIDVLLTETTYGDREHENEKQRKEVILDIVREIVERGGTLMMPAFSLERTQEIVYMLEELCENDQTLPSIPVYLDSPMAIHALPTYQKYHEYYDLEANKKYLEDPDDFLNFESLVITETVEQSKKINGVPNPKMIIAGSGMMTGGRILHHAKRYLSDPNSMLVLVGYQAEGTLGRKLYEGASQVTIHEEEVDVNCKVMAIGALSAHADKVKLLSWIKNAKKMPKKVYCIHGETHSAGKFAHALQDELGIEAHVPEFGETVEI